MPRYKRTADEAQLDLPVEPDVPSESQETLTRLRNMWEFASLMQYIYLFGHVVKIEEDFDIEDLEAECIKPSASEQLASIGLQILKYVSSHRGLTSEIFDEYTRRQYTAKAPQRNPFGEDEEPIKFNDMDIYTRIKVLHQLSIWTFGNADRIRGLMPEDEDHLNWRMEPLGWDKDDRSYYVLDDNRLYRRSDELVPPATPKAKTKAKAKSKGRSMRSSRSKATRSSKRRKIEDSEDEENDESLNFGDDQHIEDSLMTNSEQLPQEEVGYGFTSKTWECIAITLEEYQDFMASIFRSKDPNEKALRSRIEEDVLPIIEKRAEAVRQKQLKKLRELENLQKMATAKRSSRLADKAEKDKQDREEKEAEEKKMADLQMAREEQERQKRIEEGHESRRLTREQRVREREAKRILHEEELARLEEEEGGREESQGLDDAAGDVKRASERQRKTQREQHQKELEKLAESQGNWYFDCSVCGKHGENMDDGTHSIACDKCEVWQHSKCHGISHKQAESPDFAFVCATCKRKEEEAKKPKIPPLKLSNRSSGSPEVQKASSRPVTANTEESKNRLPDHVTRQLDSLSNNQSARPSPGPFAQITNGTSLTPGNRYPPIGNFALHPQQPWSGNAHSPPSQGQNGSSHQQQHQHAHQNAVASAGGHPVHQIRPYAQQPPPTNGYNAQVSRGPVFLPQSSPENQRPHHFAPQQPHAYQQQAHPHAQQAPPPGSGQLMGGFQSPEKADRKPVSASPPAQHTPHRMTSEFIPQRPNAQNSPKTYLPPPAQTYEQRSAQSPVKSSPQPAQPPASHLRSPHPPPLVQPSPTATGHRNGNFQTPQMQRSVSGNQELQPHNVAADGMSGPWPEGSKAIPQKHDQSPAPAPPPSAHSIGKVAPLIPSPNQHHATGADSIPVKKLGYPAMPSPSSQQ